MRVPPIERQGRNNNKNTDGDESLKCNTNLMIYETSIANTHFRLGVILASELTLIILITGEDGRYSAFLELHVAPTLLPGIVCYPASSRSPSSLPEFKSIRSVRTNPKLIRRESSNRLVGGPAPLAIASSQFCTAR